MSDRQAFLDKVRAAVRQGNHAGNTPPLPQRDGVGYQGGGMDPARRFVEMLEAAGGFGHLVADDTDAIAEVLALVERLQPRRVLLGSESIVAKFDLANQLLARDCEIARATELIEGGGRERFFAADLAITGVDYLIAETGTMIMLARPEQPRTASLLPPVHIAIAERAQILPDLFDLYDCLDPQAMLSCVTHITGPSKTGDIELKLVTGVHGPGEVHVVVIG
ncbi:lactate utilization protein [soil metagenome]